MFSKACEYGIRAAIFIAKESIADNRVSLEVIAEEIDSPEAFTAKILQQLSRDSIIDSRRGPYGGFVVTEQKLKKTKISEIVKAIDGDKVYTGCGLGLRKCDEKHPCPIHDEFTEIRNKLKEMLESTTLYDLATKLEPGDVYLKI